MAVDTVFHMKTTLNIDETVMRRLKETVAARGTTMSALVEAGLRRVLAAGPEPNSEDTGLKPLPSWDGGLPSVDIANREKLYRAMEEER